MGVRSRWGYEEGTSSDVLDVAVVLVCIEAGEAMRYTKERGDHQAEF